MTFTQQSTIQPYNRTAEKERRGSNWKSFLPEGPLDIDMSDYVLLQTQTRMVNYQMDCFNGDTLHS